MRMRSVLVVAAVAAALVGATAQPAQSSRYLRIGIYDEAQTLYKRYTDSYGAGQNIVNLTLLSDLGKE